MHFLQFFTKVEMEDMTEEGGEAGDPSKNAGEEDEDDEDGVRF